MKSMLLAALLLAAGVAPSAQAADLRLHALLDSTPLVPRADTDASGEATATLHDDGKATIRLVVGGITSSVAAAELHTGADNATGPVVAPLTLTSDPQLGWVAEQTLTLDAADAASMRAGDSYILVTTGDHPTGELRGQLVPQPVRLPAAPR
jgi:hypothetical protein